MKPSLQKLAASALLIGGLSACSINFSSSKVVHEHSAIGKGNTQNNGMSPTLGGKLFTSAWMQRSAEYKALCQQAYSLAELRLSEVLQTPRLSNAKPLAIVTDIDETILDNSPNSVHQALKGEDYTDKSWDKWCSLAKADTLAGAYRFFHKADQAGVAIFYVSNRSEANRAGTLANLKKYNFPQVDNQHLILRQGTSDKSARRSKILEQYDIIMLVGDNLGDFDHIFDSSKEGDRQRGFELYKEEFGRRFIILPNPNYGTWEKAMNNGYPPLETKDNLLKNKLLKSHQ